MLAMSAVALGNIHFYGSSPVSLRVWFNCQKIAFQVLPQSWLKKMVSYDLKADHFYMYTSISWVSIFTSSLCCHFSIIAKIGFSYTQRMIQMGGFGFDPSKVQILLVFSIFFIILKINHWKLSCDSPSPGPYHKVKGIICFNVVYSL